MSTMLFRDDLYLKQALCRVHAITEHGGIVPDHSLFYAIGGGWWRQTNANWSLQGR